MHALDGLSLAVLPSSRKNETSRSVTNLPTTVTRLTATVSSAIAVLEVAGPNAETIVDACWRPNHGSSVLGLNCIRFGFTRPRDGSAHKESVESDTRSSESIVVCRTDRDRIELHCHGGRLAAEQIVSDLVRNGAVNVSIGEKNTIDGFDEVRREAIQDLTKVNTVRTTSILLDQLRGALSREMEQIDACFSRGNTVEAKHRLLALKERSSFGLHLIEPWRVILAGPPNVGKSSLLNRLLGYSRAIVHEQAGTTRDLLSERSSLGGWPIELMDGAGIRNVAHAEDQIEVVGIDRTLYSIAQADCVLLLVDSERGWTDDHAQILARCSNKVIFVWTKCDIGNAVTEDASDALSKFEIDSIAIQSGSAIRTSSFTGVGLHDLMTKIVNTLVPNSPIRGESVPFRARHVAWIDHRLALIPF
jgi:tRNA modification GTPase